MTGLKHKRNEVNEVFLNTLNKKPHQLLAGFLYIKNVINLTSAS